MHPFSGRGGFSVQRIYRTSELDLSGVLWLWLGLWVYSTVLPIICLSLPGPRNLVGHRHCYSISNWDQYPSAVRCAVLIRCRRPSLPGYGLEKIARVWVSQVGIFLQIIHPMFEKAATPATRQEYSLTSRPITKCTDVPTQNLPANRVRVPADAKMPLGACHSH